MSEAAPLLGGGGATGESAFASPRKSTSRASRRVHRVRAACAWLSKRKALNYEDLTGGHPEELAAVREVRDEIASGGLSSSAIARWQSGRKHDVAVGKVHLPMDDTEARVEALLRRLWSCVFTPSSASASTSLSFTASGKHAAHAQPPVLEWPGIPSPRWKLLGFQQEDPRTDLRAVGTAGLWYLLRFVESDEFGTAAPALAVARGCALGRELPLSIAAFNVMACLAAHLHLTAGSSPPSYCPCCGAAVRANEYGSRSQQSHRGASLRGFLLLTLTHPDAFFYLFSLTLLRLAAEWRANAPPGSRTSTASSSGGDSDSGWAAAVAALPADAGGMQTGDKRLLHFPSMLCSVRQTVMTALAGVSNLPVHQQQHGALSSSSSSSAAPLDWPQGTQQAQLHALLARESSTLSTGGGGGYGSSYQSSPGGGATASSSASGSGSGGGGRSGRVVDLEALRSAILTGS